MATIERRGKRFRLIFHFSGRRFTASLKTSNQREADAAAGCVERTLMLMQQGALAAPPGADFVTFVLSGGRLDEKPKPPPIRTLSEVKEDYIEAHRVGAMEANSLATVKMHLGHFVETLGGHFPVHSLALTHLQQHVHRRAGEKGFFGQPISPVTLRKEVASFRACWNWG